MKIKLLACLFILILLSTSNSYAQWGVKGGGNYTDISRVSPYVSRLGFHIGGTYELKLSEKWYVQPELLFTTAGCNFDNFGGGIKDGYIKMYAFELPVNFSFRPKILKTFTLLTDMGLYARYAIDGNSKYVYADFLEKPTQNTNPFEFFNRFDFGLNLGLGLQKNHCSATLTFQRGLSHAAKGSDEYHQGFKLSLGYKF